MSNTCRTEGFEERNSPLEIMKKKLFKNGIQIYSSNEQEDIVKNDFILYQMMSTKLGNINLLIENLSEMRLSRCKITQLPADFGLLQLKHLDLSHNELKEVPECLYSGLKRLENLNLSYNLLTTFDRDPQWLLNIRKIKLNNNYFESLPKWVMTFKSSNLEDLNFSTNNAQQYRYRKNSYNIHIMGLKKLKLRNSHLTDNDFGFLKCFEHLQFLDISNKHQNYTNQHSEIEKLFLKPTWRRMKVLKLNNLCISMFPEPITSLVSLTELHINNNCISYLYSGIELMVNLVVLDISQNQISGIPENLTKLVALEELKASNNFISNAPDFTSIPALRVLDLYDNELEEVSYNSESVQSIDLEKNYLNTDVLEDSQYEKKKYILRVQIESSDLRMDGPKVKEDENYDSLSDSIRCTSQDDSDYEPNEGSITDNVISESSQTIYECWDSPGRNSLIDKVDEEWIGFEDTSDIGITSVIQGVSLEDEDWMFVDVE